ncbi:Fibropellin-1 [Portunus trituberculatus]|uniref:Fibropellin-1 n=1 Tax=Portunus trituberculatus TaxID=210409 RepID=A0A5B7CU62_PORTR|nr:Fibropellin-1 [Portunus trituberculatus]
MPRVTPLLCASCLGLGATHVSVLMARYSYRMACFYLADHIECHSQVASSRDCKLFCLKGKCIITDQGPKCQCDPKFDGVHCDHYRCSGYCKNGGFCQVESDKLSCHCTGNWTGPLCETPMPTCDNFCENNGTCHELSGKPPYCTCNAMFTGDRCDQCKALPCENGGTCRLRVRNGTYAVTPMCSCAPGYNGVSCTLSVCDGYCKHMMSFPRLRDSRDFSPYSFSAEWADKEKTSSSALSEADIEGSTVAGAPVQSKAGDFPSVSASWDGAAGDVMNALITQCDNLCADVECHNGGNCIMTGPPQPKARCSCVPGYHGSSCQFSLCDTCVNGQCSIRSGMPHCECDPGWTGRLCQDRTCHEGDEHCGCPVGYHGKNCDHHVCENYCYKPNFVALVYAQVLGINEL